MPDFAYYIPLKNHFYCDKIIKLVYHTRKDTNKGLLVTRLIDTHFRYGVT